MSRSRRTARRTPWILAPTILLLLTACAGTPNPASQSADPPGESSPEPERIAALSSDAADTLVQLVGPERLIVVPETTTSETTGNHPDLMAQVPNTIPSVAHIDPEQILSYKPDLVVLTTRHDSERATRDLLQESGIEVVAIENNWATFDEIADNVETLAAATGTQERGTEIIHEFREQVDAVTKAVTNAADHPSVLVMTALGPQKPYLLGTDSISSLIAETAGAELAGRSAGIDKAMQADPELVLRANPDAIVLLDSGGRGVSDYDTLLQNPALAGVQAIKDNRVLLLPSTDASATAGVHVTDGLRRIAEWLHPDLFGSR